MSIGLPGKAVETKFTANPESYACGTPFGEDSDKNVPDSTGFYVHMKNRVYRMS